MKTKFLILTILIAIFCGNVFGQDKMLSMDNTIDIVRKYHPIVKQAYLQNEIAKNELLSSKSVFDPSFQISTDEKNYDNKLYYKYTSTELKIPIWYGIDLKAGTENNIGDRIDPTLTNNQSAFIGLSMDPFRGIIIDKRNSIVKQAKYFVELTKNEQLIVVNDLLLDATNAYWNWANAFYNNAILKKSVQNNRERFEIIKRSYLSGDRASIDTTEALTQIQTFEIMQAQSEMDLQKARLELSNYFWTENGLPFELDEKIKPINNFDLSSINTLELGKLEELVNQAFQIHPKLKMIESKANILDIEKRLKAIEFFPALKLNYNALENNFSNIYNSLNTTNNVKYGVTLQMPIFQRKVKGEIAKTKNKIEDLNWDKKYFTLEIENKVKSSFVEFYALKQQIKKNEDILKANKLLFETENMKFQMGESSLFIINNRELKLIETEQKHIALKTKLFQSMYKNLWAIGKLQ